MWRQSILDYRGFRYLKLAGLLAALSVLGYWATLLLGGGAAYGGTGYGYGLGILSAALVILLLWYGVRLRLPPRHPERRQGRRDGIDGDADGTGSAATPGRRKSPAGETWRHGNHQQGWLSAHVYLGAALIVVATLHTGFRLGWNIHSLAYALLLLVSASGFYGLFAYFRYPRLITENLGDDSLDDILLRIAELDDRARQRALALPDEVAAVVTASRLGTRVRGSLLQPLRAGDAGCPTDFAVLRLEQLSRELVSGNQPALMRDLYALLVQKQGLVRRARNDIRFTARLRYWLYLHTPLSIALFAALLAHVTTILVYW